MVDLSIGSLGITAKEFKGLVQEVAEEGRDVRQAAYDGVMEVLAEKATPQEVSELLAQLTPEGLALLAVEKPDELTGMLQHVRNNLMEGA